MTVPPLSPPSSLPPSPRARRLAAPRWLDLRLALGVLLVLASVLIGARVVSGAHRTYTTVAARHDLAAGTVLGAADLRLARVQLPGHGRGVYLADVDDAVGHTLVRGVSAGELVPADAVAEMSEQTTVSVPLAAGAAPSLRKGQRIEVWVSTKGCSSLVLLPEVTVQAVRADPGGSFASGTGAQDVVISVRPDLADRVVEALALEDVQLRAGVLVGPDAARARSAPAALPELAPCATPTVGR